MTSGRHVVSLDPSVRPMVLMVQYGRTCINYINYIIHVKKIVDLCFGRHGELLNSELNHIDLHSMSVNVTFTFQ